MKIQIKRASNVDGLTIATIEHMIFTIGSYKYRNIISMINDDNYMVVVGAVAKRIVGYCMILITVDDLELIRIGVRTDFWHQGVATQMMAWLLSMFRSLQKQRIILEVDEENQNAQQLYRKCGFVQCGVRERYYAGHNALIMSFDK